MLRGLATVLLLVVSNAFMTLAWYGHIAFKSKLERFGLMVIVLFQLVHRPVRILLPGPGQPHRIGRVRRPVLDLGTESDPGSRLALGLHALRAGVHEIRHAALEPFSPDSSASYWPSISSSASSRDPPEKAQVSDCSDGARRLSLPYRIRHYDHERHITGQHGGEVRGHRRHFRSHPPAERD